MELPASINAYRFFWESLRKLPEAQQTEAMRGAATADLYCLFRYMLRRPDAEHPWIFSRCRAVQGKPDGCLDLVFRGGYKSSIITFALVIQDILKNPEIRVCILSHTRPHARGFLRQIKSELEQNEGLKFVFPDILWADPQKESPKWSEEDGITVRRNTNPKEATVEAFGLVDGQPTGRHYDLLVYDDIVVRESVTTPEQIQKTTDAWALSLNLASLETAKRYVGTRYHFADTYGEILQRGAAEPRVQAVTEDGTPTGEPILLTREQVAEKRREMGPYVFAAQMLMNPLADEASAFKVDWLKYHESGSNAGLNIYITVDPANSKKKSSDYTAIWVIGLGGDENWYCLDLYRDRLNLTQRADLIFRLVKKWRPLSVGWEEYGMQADISHLRERMNRENYHFPLVPLGGKLSKTDRIKRLLPIFEQGRVLLPQSAHRTNYEGKTEDLIDVFIHQEYLAFPVSRHDDMLDSLARVLDEELHASWPMVYEEPKARRYGPKPAKGSWMSSL